MAEQRPVALAPVPRFRKAYATVLLEIRGLRKADCLTLNLDIASTVATVIGAWPKIRKLRDKPAKVPCFDPIGRDEGHTPERGQLIRCRDFYRVRSIQ